MQSSHLLILTLLVVLCTAEKCDYTKESFPGEEYVSVDVSPECAALLLVGGGVAGSAATLAVTNLLMPMWLCSSGFCAAGVKSGSLAAWWQSTMPLIASKSIFATLQSIAMSAGGVGFSTSSTAALGAALGGAAGAAYLGEFCQMVDQIEPSTVAAEAIKANLKFYQGFSRAAAAAAPYVTEAKNVASEVITGTWNWFSAIIEEGRKGLEEQGAMAQSHGEEARDSRLSSNQAV